MATRRPPQLIRLPLLLLLCDWTIALRFWAPQVHRHLPRHSVLRASGSGRSDEAPPPQPLGTVTLVGAGPGDPDLLTLGAAKVLADESRLVIADRLVSKEVLAMVKGELRVAQKLPGCQEKAQQEIYRWTEEAVRNGTDVVRLKIGDPFVFGRGSEEVLEFRQRLGIEAAVVPGVSAAFASPLLGGIPVTHRGVANSLIVCTGYGKEYSRPALQRYHPDQTAVFLMAVGRLRELCERLVSDEVGYPEDCPVGIVERASCPDQRVVQGTVATIADVAEALDVQAPATIVIGGVAHVLNGEQHGLVERGNDTNNDDDDDHVLLEQQLNHLLEEAAAASNEEKGEGGGARDAKQTTATPAPQLKDPR